MDLTQAVVHLEENVQIRGQSGSVRSPISQLGQRSSPRSQGSGGAQADLDRSSEWSEKPTVGKWRNCKLGGPVGHVITVAV